MDKVRMNQILEILLSPYTDTCFEQNSGFCDLLRIYRDVTDERKEAGFESRHKERISKYNSAYKRTMNYYRRTLSHPPRNMDDIKMLFELFFPLKEAAEDKPVKFFMENVMRIADSLLTFRDGEIAIRTWKNSGADIFGAEKAFNKVEVWNNLIRVMAPDILIAAFSIKGGNDIDSLYSQGSQICMADKLLKKIIQKGIAETHMHLNAGYEFQEIWEYNMNIPLWLEDLSRSDITRYGEKKLKVLFAALIRMDMACFLGEPRQKRGEYKKYKAKDHLNRVRKKIRDSVLEDKELELESEAYQEFIRDAVNLDAYDGGDYLFQSLYAMYKDLNCGSEMIFLYKCIEYCISGQYDEYFAKIFFQYIRLKNTIYRYGVERNEIGGLNRFQDYFAKSKDTARILDKKQAFLTEAALRRHMRMPDLKKLEVRVAPMGIAPDRGAAEYQDIEEDLKTALLLQTKELLSLYRKQILEMAIGYDNAKQHMEKENEEEKLQIFSKIAETYTVKQVMPPVLGIVFHFLKQDSIDNITGNFCWQEISDERIKYSDHRIVQRKKMENLSRAIEEIRNEIPNLDEYIVGIDAASDENASEPWDMLPAYTAIRNRHVSKPVLYDESSKLYYKVNNIGFTYHVGEDFRHPLSGFRHVDEVIEHFRFRSGDRLGHAIVLGMNVDKWVVNNDVVVLKAGEELENYLWLWGKAVHDQWQIPVQVEALERNIYRIAEDIYDVKDEHNIGNITIDMLYKAYRQKFEADHEKVLAAYRSGSGESIFCNSKEVCKIHPHKTSGDYRNDWNHEKLLCAQYCPEFEKRNNRSVMVTIHDSDAKLLNYIQNKLLRVVEEKGIFIEGNPTSNLAIGEIASLAEHPIFKLNKLVNEPDSHNAMVTINSDDPSVFATNVANEIAYIYHELRQEGYKEEDILTWIDKVRNYGMEGSFIKEVKSAETVFDEVTNILETIEWKVRRI